MDSLKVEFLNKEVWILSFGGAFQRANVYKKNIDESLRKEFRKSIQLKIEECVKKDYMHQTPTSDKHCNNLIAIKKWTDKNFSQILSANEIKLGVVQKLLNLYLKYLWCLGKVCKPPHCPIDRIIISKLDIKNPPNWTTLNDIRDYMYIVEKITQNANGIDIADWELEAFERR